MSRYRFVAAEKVAAHGASRACPETIAVQPMCERRIIQPPLPLSRSSQKRHSQIGTYPHIV